MNKFLCRYSEVQAGLPHQSGQEQKRHQARRATQWPSVAARSLRNHEGPSPSQKRLRCQQRHTRGDDKLHKRSGERRFLGKTKKKKT